LYFFYFIVPEISKEKRKKEKKKESPMELEEEISENLSASAAAFRHRETCVLAAFRNYFVIVLVAY
jgi:hypothetical protein